MINVTTLFWKYNIYNFRWKEKKDVYILSTWGDVKDPDVKSRFNEETKRKANMIIDYNKSMGGVDKLDQFRSYYDVAGKKFWKYIFYTYFNISIINSFICFKKSKSIHARYSLLSYKNALLHAFIAPYSKSVSIYISIVKSDSFTRVVTSDVVLDYRVVVYSSKRCVYCRDVLQFVQRTSY